MPKAVALMSGGLDSMLAVKLVQIQGVEVHALHFVSVFNCGAKPGARLSAARAAEALGCPLEIVNFTARQMEILRDPPHGFGSAANPCIDCHMAMLLHAANRMKEIGADFIVTGEVAGQRPMSQRKHALSMINSETGLGDVIVRPLSAKALPETQPERDGLLDRERLEGITGRTRSRQMALAKQFGLDVYPSPAGGCLLTDKGFGLRVKDLIGHSTFEINDAHLIKVGRHYRLDEDTKVIVGRNERENGVIETFARDGDIVIFLEDIMGPTTLLRGEATEENIQTAAALCARSTKAKNSVSVRLRVKAARSNDPGRVIEVAPATDELAAALTLSLKEKV